MIERGFKTVAAIILILIISTSAGFSEIYQYQDKNGNWHFTDSPPEEKAPEEITEMTGMIENAAGLKDLQDHLKAKYQPVGKIEAATLATVAITSPAGSGSGFFISESGHLLTNRHVIRGDERLYEFAEEFMGQVDKDIEVADAHMKAEEAAIRSAESKLDQLKTDIEHMDRESEKAAAQAAYTLQYQRLQSQKATFKEKKAHYLRKKRAYQDEKWQFRYQKTTADISRRFTVSLKDGTEVIAYLIRSSRAHDLALLKIDGYKTPFLNPDPGNGIRQGGPVYAIGNPLTLRDSVSRGVFSGYENGFIKTDAKIYPGNSGGPLVNEEGEVVGINTFKKLTHNFEGLGFAIPIDTALTEFNDILAGNGK